MLAGGSDRRRGGLGEGCQEGGGGGRVGRLAVGRAAVAAVVVGGALAQSPYLLPPALTLEQAAAADATLAAVLIGIGIGLVVLVPSLVLLYRLVLRGVLDQGYEPLDQRFKPLSAADDPEPPR